MTGVRVPDARLWQSVAATLRDVVAPGLRPGHELDTVVQLQGLAAYAASRPSTRARSGPPASRTRWACRGWTCRPRWSARPRCWSRPWRAPGTRTVARRVREELLRQLDEDVVTAAPLLDTFSGHPATDVEPLERRVPEQELRALTTWFGEALGGPVEVTRATVLSGGHSRRMLVLDVTGPQGPASYVVRIEQGGTFGTDGTLEAEAMRALGRAGVAVAPVRWIERDPEPLGHPFFVMDLVPGGSAVDDAVLETFLQALHAVHAVDPQELADSLGPPPSPEQAVQAQVERWLGVYRESVPVPVPLLDEAAAWLRRHLRPTGPVAVVHGDPGPGNFLHQDGTITALTDWEFVHHGDAAEDWAYFATIRSRKLKSAEQWYAAIERAVGVRNDRATWHAWEAFNQFKGACANLTALRLFADGTSTTPNLLAIGTAVHARFLRRLAELVGGTGPVRAPGRAGPAPERVDPRVVQTRRAVYAATLAVIAESGVQAATVERIADRAGVSRSTVYRRWPSLAQLYCEAFGTLAVGRRTSPAATPRPSCCATCRTTPTGSTTTPTARCSSRCSTPPGATRSSPRCAASCSTSARRGPRPSSTPASRPAGCARTSTAGRSWTRSSRPSSTAALVEQQRLSRQDVRRLRDDVLARFGAPDAG